MSTPEQNRNRRIALVVGILVVLGAIIAAGSWYSSGGTKPVSTPKVTVATGLGSVVLGKASAPVKVIIYEDFLCPFCRELEEATRDFLRENAADGKVQVEYRPINALTDYPYSARALNTWAAVLAGSTPQAALKLHDLLYRNQPATNTSDDVSDADLAALVTKVGADDPTVLAALKVENKAFFKATRQAMARAGVTAIPTVFINGGQVPAGAVTDLVATIEAAVAKGR